MAARPARSYRTPAAVFLADPKATPPDPAEPPPPPPPPPRLRHPLVAVNGNCGVAGKIIQVGRRYARQTIIALVEGATISLFDPAGTHIRTVQTTPDQHFYGSGTPRGGDRRTQKYQAQQHSGTS